MNKKILISVIAVIVVVVSIVTYFYLVPKPLQISKYERHGFSFEYPQGLKIKEEKEDVMVLNKRVYDEKYQVTYEEYEVTIHVIILESDEATIAVGSVDYVPKKRLMGFGLNETTGEYDVPKWITESWPMSSESTGLSVELIKGLLGEDFEGFIPAEEVRMEPQVEGQPMQSHDPYWFILPKSISLRFEDELVYTTSTSFYCDTSERIFHISTMSSVEDLDQQVFQLLFESFACH